jgi:hypothetical protein
LTGTSSKSLDAAPPARIPPGTAHPMLNSLLTSIFGSRNERLLKQLSVAVK